MKDRIYDYLKNKKILLLGFGLEGKSTYHFIRSCDKDIMIGISDIHEITDSNVLNDTNVVLYSGNHYLSVCQDYDIIIKGPGVVIKECLNSKVKERITCQTDLFLRFCTNMTIGITGTKGKSTTSSLLYHMLKNLNKDVVFVGNIGIPCFDILDELNEDTICILELGCHQLEYMRNSPNISAILNIYEEHLDHYVSMNEYVNAKKNIYLHQKSNDYIILGDSLYLRDYSSCPGHVLSYGKNENRDFFFFDKDNLYIQISNKNILIPISNILTNLKGIHNLYNILVCLTIIEILGLNLEQAISCITSFKGLSHRLEYVGTYDDISFYDDSIATSIPSVIYAVDALKNVNTIIIGGMDRGLDYTPLVEYLNSSDVKNIVLLPATSSRIFKIFQEKKSSKEIFLASDMKDAVNIAKMWTEKSKICLLSPAAASYGFYKNFEERGNDFQKCIRG